MLLLTVSPKLNFHTADTVPVTSSDSQLPVKTDPGERMLAKTVNMRRTYHMLNGLL